MDGKISEQRVYYKIQAQLGFPLTEIHADLQKVYGNGAHLSKANTITYLFTKQQICYSLQVGMSF